LNKLIPLKSCALTLVLTSVLAISSTLVAATSDPLSRIELVETLAPLIPIEKQMDGDRTGQYTDLASITDPQRLILNGYLAQSKAKAGTGGSLFSPTMGATRAQAAVMIHRMVSAANPKWTSAITESTPVLDANTVAWAKASIVDLVNAGVIETVGPGYVFPNRSVSLETATQWVASARVFIPKPAPIAVVQAVPTETQPTAAIVTVLTEPVTPTEDVTAPTAIQTKATQDHQWEVRVYGSLSLGQSPYQSNQPPAEVAEERYEKADVGPEPRTNGSGSPEKKRTYGLESGIEFSRKVIEKPLWLVAGYGYGIVKETMPATTITMPVVYLQDITPNNPPSALTTADSNNPYEIFQLTDQSVRKTAHTIRLGLRHSIYEKTLQATRIEGYWGGGLAISTSAIWGSTIELPKQNINKNPINFLSPGSREDYITREKIRSFYHTQTQASVYGELGGLIHRNLLHVGVQTRFQLNPGELSVDEKGNKRLTREITSLATLFVGRRF
jgi:hypothetical protein